MGDYDITLKSLFYRNTRKLFEQLTGSAQARWLNTEFVSAKPTARQVDLLAETVGGELVHIEFQSVNDPNMPCRQMEYSVLIYRDQGRFPSQFVLYVGEAPMRMASRVEANRFQYHLVDIRDLDGAGLLNSADVEDNILAVLTRGFDNRETLRTVLRRIVALDGEQRGQAIAQLTTLAKLRKLEITLKQEVETMPITIDIRAHAFYTEGFEEGRQSGMEEGRQSGMEEGSRRQSRHFLQRMLEVQFGPLPDSANARLQVLSVDQMETLATRIFRCGTLEEVFREEPS